MEWEVAGALHVCMNVYDMMEGILSLSVERAARQLEQDTALLQWLPA